MVIERSDGEEEGDDEEASSSMYGTALDAESDYCTAPPVTDKERHADVIYCQPEYADDIYGYMRWREERLRPKSAYMRKQKDINEEMRTILVDWLIDVTVEYDLQIVSYSSTVPASFIASSFRKLFTWPSTSSIECCPKWIVPV